MSLFPASGTTLLLVLISIGALCGISQGGPFIIREGSNFMKDGQPYFYVGANFWQGANLGVYPDRLRNELDRLQELGITNLRVWASSDGPDTQPYRWKPSIQPFPGVYNPQVLQGLDLLLNEMSLRGMYAVMVLNNFWHCSGGMAQYVSWATGTDIPYPNDPPHDWQAFQAYAMQFYSCYQCQQWWQNYISMIISRVNTVNQRKYSEDPTIFSWEIANEPRNFPLSWLNDTATFIKGLDSNHMLTVGMEGYLPPVENVTDEWVAAHSHPLIDYSTFHIWVQNRGYYDPMHPNDTFPYALEKAAEKLQLHQTQSLKIIGKPTVLEEFGLARDFQEYSPNTPTTMRDLYYEDLMSQVYETASSGDGGLSGVGFWAWSGSAYPPDPWVGDPPHEPAGWYSVYDVDLSTHAVILEYSSLMSSLNNNTKRTSSF